MNFLKSVKIQFKTSTLANQQGFSTLLMAFGVTVFILVPFPFMIAPSLESKDAARRLSMAMQAKDVAEEYAQLMQRGYEIGKDVAAGACPAQAANEQLIAGQRFCLPADICARGVCSEAGYFNAENSTFDVHWPEEMFEHLRPSWIERTARVLNSVSSTAYAQLFGGETFMPAVPGGTNNSILVPTYATGAACEADANCQICDNNAATPNRDICVRMRFCARDLTVGVAVAAGENCNTLVDDEWITQRILIMKNP